MKQQNDARKSEYNPRDTYLRHLIPRWKSASEEWRQATKREVSESSCFLQTSDAGSLVWFNNPTSSQSLGAFHHFHSTTRSPIPPTRGLLRAAADHSYLSGQHRSLSYQTGQYPDKEWLADLLLTCNDSQFFLFWRLTRPLQAHMCIPASSICSFFLFH